MRLRSPPFFPKAAAERFWGVSSGDVVGQQSEAGAQWKREGVSARSLSSIVATHGLKTLPAGGLRRYRV